MRVNKIFSILMMLVVFAVTWIKPIWPEEQVLQSSLTIFAWFWLWFHVQKYGMHDTDFFLILLFLCFHSVAARWLYSNVPYDAWLKGAFGISIDQSFGFKRNHFDRVVHFLYGLCLTAPIMSYARATYLQSMKLSAVAALVAIMVSSLFYEWFEWLIAATLSAQDAESYNGQQGDMWDAHKDMLLATAGSVLCGLIKCFVDRNSAKMVDTPT
jgi:putative membrane protein